MDNEARIKAIEKEFVRLALIDIVPTIMFGFALHATFVENGQPVFDILKNENFVTLLFVISIPIITLCSIKSFKLSAERRTLEKEQVP